MPKGTANFRSFIGWCAEMSQENAIPTRMKTCENWRAIADLDEIVSIGDRSWFGFWHGVNSSLHA
jgi:hypothetical protein